MIALSAAAWLFRHWLKHRLSIELETYKAQLEQKLDVLKTELSIYAHEQNVGLSRIDAQRSKAIRSIWALLGKWHERFLSLTAPNQALNQDLSLALSNYHQWARELMTIANELSIEVRKRAILVNQVTYEVIKRYCDSISDVTNDFYAASFEGIDIAATEDLASLFHRVQQARGNLRASSAAANANEFRDALVYEFRVLMKAEKVANPAPQRTPASRRR